MSKQTVLRVKSQNGPDGIQSQEEEIPKVGKHEVLVKVRGVTLNYRDLIITTGDYPFPVKKDVVPGSDGSGEIVEVGEGVSGFQKGDKVIGSFDITHQYGPQRDWEHGQGGPIDGVLRQYVPLPASAVVKIPEGSPQSYLEWACLVCTGTTAYNALYGNNPLKPGQTVLLQGTGGVSITGLILAKAAGATTIITSSSDDKLKYVKDKFGAHHTINYKTTPNWGEEAKKITGGRGVDFVLENGGSGTIEQSVAAITNGGIIAIIGFLSLAEQSKMPDVTQLALGKGCVIRGINVGSRELLEECVRFVAERGLRMPIEKDFKFTRDGVVEAYNHLKSGQHIGKIGINVN